MSTSVNIFQAAMTSGEPVKALPGIDVTSTNNEEFANLHDVDVDWQSLLRSLSEGRPDEIDLADARLEMVEQSYMNLDRAKLDNAKLHSAILNGCSLKNVSLVKADLSFARLDNANLEKANIENGYVTQSIKRLRSNAERWNEWQPCF